MEQSHQLERIICQSIGKNRLGYKNQYLFNHLQKSIHSTGAFFIQESEDDMGVRVVFPDMGKDPSVQLIEKTITENGTYDAITDGANGYSKVNVNVEGGGGSSDFSTAKMTVINNKTATTVDDVQCNNCPVVVVEYNELGGGFSVNANSQIVFDVILYKGHAHIYEMVTDVPNNIPVNLETEVSLSGGAVLNDGIDITGDCTITIS